MNIAERMAGIATGVSARLGAGFWPARVVSVGAAEVDAGGSIVTPGVVTERDCSAMVDAVTEAMRLAEGFTERDVRILVLAGTLAGQITTDDRVEVLAGPNAGAFSVESVGRDPAGLYFELRGRRG